MASQGLRLTAPARPAVPRPVRLTAWWPGVKVHRRRQGLGHAVARSGHAGRQATTVGTIDQATQLLFHLDRPRQEPTARPGTPTSLGPAAGQPAPVWHPRADPTLPRWSRPLDQVRSRLAGLAAQLVLVGGAGIEPTTSSMSSWRSPD